MTRVAVYGVGQYGQEVIRLAERQGWQVVAAFNRAGPKVGRDVGELAGLGRRLGVVVQDCERADFDLLEADIGVVTTTDRISENFPAYERLLSAGCNVICHGGEAIHPTAIDPELGARIDELAKANDVSFTGTGIWDMSRVWSGLLVTGPCTQITSLYHRSVTDTEGFAAPIVLGTGTGMSPEEFDRTIAAPGASMGGLYPIVMHLVLSALGYTVTSCTERREPVLLEAPFYCKTLDRELAAGSCAGMRSVIEAHTKEGVTGLAHMEARVFFRPEDTEHMHWAVEGHPSARITVERDDASDMTIASLFNRIPDVIAAPPGIQLVTQLGPLRSTARR
jgi:4-hydroxy-tetrahydrodipicolinate reductase